MYKLGKSDAVIRTCNRYLASMIKGNESHEMTDRKSYSHCLGATNSLATVCVAMIRLVGAFCDMTGAWMCSL